MKVSKSYWVVSISNETVRTSMPNKEYRELQRTFRSKASSILGNRFEFKTQKEALAAQNKLPSEMHSWVQVRESFPVSLGLGWI